jgi:NAD(P)-dependent dehydrogenase (short-subunit alcohol dehydrogenase family)
MKLPEELQFIENARKPQKTTTERLDGKWCIVTGATSGVGYQAAYRLAEGGTNLILVVRNPEKADLLKNTLHSRFGITVETVISDFSRIKEVREAANKILANHSRVDVLINNAGIHNTHRELTEDGFEKVFAVNHLAPFLFTQLLLPLMVASAPSRIIQVNSQGHRFGGLDLTDLDWSRRKYNGYRAYGAAKTAQLLTTWEFADQLHGKPVTINAMHPGEVRTNIGMNNGWLYRAYQKYLLRWVLSDPAISGEAIYYLSASPEMIGVTGKYFNKTIEEQPAKYALDRTQGHLVWDKSLELTTNVAS